VCVAEYITGDDATREKLCKHGIGHPFRDPTPEERKQWGRYWGTHTCDGCCNEEGWKE
jgi:hypothetical protein